MTVKTQESIGTFRRMKGKRSAIHDHDERLKTALIDACEDNQIPDGIKNEIVEKGLHRFVIDKENNVRSISAWSDLNEYITSYKENALKEKRSAGELADQRATKKQELFDLLCHYAKVGDMKAYRTARAEYALL